MITSHPSIEQVLVTDSISINCSATAIPPPTIIWMKNGAVVSNVSTTSVTQDVQSDTTTSTLTLSNVSLADTASYSCMAQNFLETLLFVSSTNASITVLCKL